MGKTKQELLSKTVEHIDITSFDARSIILTIAGSTQAAGCIKISADLVKYNMVDAIVATGASIVDMDFFEALGFKHYQGSPFVDDQKLRANYIDRIYDTYIDEKSLQVCDKTIFELANQLEPRAYSSREFISEMSKWLAEGHAKKPDSLVQLCHEKKCPFFALLLRTLRQGLAL